LFMTWCLRSKIDLTFCVGRHRLQMQTCVCSLSQVRWALISKSSIRSLVLLRQPQLEFPSSSVATTIQIF
jgi:hypothetical protein